MTKEEIAKMEHLARMAQSRQPQQPQGSASDILLAAALAPDYKIPDGMFSALEVAREEGNEEIVKSLEAQLQKQYRARMEMQMSWAAYILSTGLAIFHEQYNANMQAIAAANQKSNFTA